MKQKKDLNKEMCKDMNLDEAEQYRLEKDKLKKDFSAVIK